MSTAAPTIYSGNPTEWERVERCRCPWDFKRECECGVEICDCNSVDHECEQDFEEAV
jgi:hypothetical protein